MRTQTKEENYKPREAGRRIRDINFAYSLRAGEDTANYGIKEV